MTYIDCLRKMGYLVLTPGNKLVTAKSYVIKHFCKKTNKFEEVEFFNEFHNQVKFIYFDDEQLDTTKIAVYKNISNSDERPLYHEVL